MKSCKKMQKETILSGVRSLRRVSALAVAIGVFSAGALNANATVTNTWAVDSNGVWSDVANWASANIPTNAGDVAKLTYAITADKTVTLNTPVKVGSLLMSINSKGFILATSGSGSLTMNNGSGYAVLKSGPGSGRNKVNINVALESNLDVINATGTYFDIGPFSGTNDIHINRTSGTGTPYVGGSSTGFTGNWHVYAGDLMTNNGEPFGNTTTGTRTITLYNNAGLRNNGTATLNANRRIVIDASGGSIKPNTRAMTLNAADQLAGSGKLTYSDQNSGAFVLNAANDFFIGWASIGGSISITNRFVLGANGSINNCPLISLTAANGWLDVTGKAAGYNVPAGQVVAGVGSVRGKMNVTTAGAKVHPGTYTLPGPITAPGTLTITNGLSMASGGAYLWDLNSLKDNATGVAGTHFGKLNVTAGAVSLSGGVLTLGFVGISDPNSGNAFWKTEHTWTILTGTAPPSGKLVVSNNTWNDGVFLTRVTGNTLELVYQRGLDLTMIIIR